MTREKRKHVRVEHRGTVQFVTGNRSIQGSSVNISRTGMQVVVNLPQTHDTIHGITFDLPVSEQSIRVPCRLVRAEGGGGAEGQTVGIEFLPDAETQLLLIERFVEDSARRSGEARQLPRTACRILGVETDVEGMRVLSVDNLSTEGVLFTYSGKLEPGDALSLVLKPPEDLRPLRLRGSVVYVLRHAFREVWTAGMRFEGLGEIELRRLCNLVLALSSGSTVREMYDHLDSRASDAGFRIQDETSITSLLSGLCTWRVPLNMLLESSPTIRECALVEVRDDEGTLELQILDGQVGSAATPECTAYIGFPLDGASHYFRSRVAGGEADRLVLELPTSVFRSDKRSQSRETVGGRSKVRLLLGSPGTGEREVEGSLIDISRQGFLCELDASLEPAISAGDQVRYRVDATLGLDDHGQVRHLQLFSAGGERALRVGIEAGLARWDIQSEAIGAEAWNRDRPYLSGSVEPPDDPLESTLVSYRDRAGRVVRALLNATPAAVRAPVVVIPPSYSKRKESYAPLVATLLANFRRLGRPLVTLRYDGVNRPGESHNDVLNPRRGYEMLSYRISQGQEDLEAALDFVSRNPYFEPEQVVLITFSMSSVDAQRYLATRDAPSVTYWISCMGVPSAQTTLRNILGGIDIIANHRLGVPNGIMGLLGHLVNTDVMARDAVENRCAYITDARADMARIEVPVLWIRGQYDRWVDSEEVHDLMSVRSPGAREMLDIPCGHNLRSSDDAIQTYRIIAGKLLLHLHGDRIVPCDPCKSRMLGLVTRERERLEDRSAPPMEEYWRGYLVGNERNSRGYDFYRELAEYGEFLDVELALLRPEEGGELADLGCGTGLLEERILKRLARAATVEGPSSRPLRVTAVDLVPEALERARRKWEEGVRAHPLLGIHRLETRVMNLEPNRLLPVRHFLDDARLGYGYLHGRVEGLSAETLVRIGSCALPEVHALMHGEPADAVAPDVGRRLAAALRQEDVDAVMDFNRAARFLLRRLTPEDLGAPSAAAGFRPEAELASRAPLDPTRYRDLTTAALRFDRLCFGVCGPELHLDFPEASFGKALASLFVSYLFNPDGVLEELFRALKPGGTLVVSSMRPDSDVSAIFTRYVERMQRLEPGGHREVDRDGNLGAARAMLNEAASLFQLEEDGYFRFYTADELVAGLEAAGFVEPRVAHSFGDPPQAAIVAVRRPDE